MPTFIYRAKNGPTKTVEGELVAESETVALAKIDGMGFVPVWVQVKGSTAGSGRGLRFSRIKQRDITVFTRQLAGLVKSGVPILRALRTVGAQSASVRFRGILEEIEARVRDGRMLSEAMVEHPRIFPELYVNMVRSGESAGILDEILLRLADAMEKEEQVRRKVQSALAYPALVLGVGILTVVAMLVFFLPGILALFEGFEELPASTRALMHISKFFESYWLGMVASVGLASLILARLSSGTTGRKAVDLLKLQLPLFGRLVKEAEVARFARTMSLLIGAGVPVERALSLGGATMKNRVLRAEIDDVISRTVHQGMSVTAGLERCKHFPVFVRNMVATGEEGGRLDESMADVASFYEREVEGHISLVTSLIEPILILGVGGIVGFIVFATLMPIIDLTKTIQ